MEAKSTDDEFNTLLDILQSVERNIPEIENEKTVSKTKYENSNGNSTKLTIVSKEGDENDREELVAIVEEEELLQPDEEVSQENLSDPVIESFSSNELSVQSGPSSNQPNSQESEQLSKEGVSISSSGSNEAVELDLNKIKLRQSGLSSSKSMVESPGAQYSLRVSSKKSSFDKEVVTTITRKRKFWMNVLSAEQENMLESLSDAELEKLAKETTRKQSQMQSNSRRTIENVSFTEQSDRSVSSSNTSSSSTKEVTGKEGHMLDEGGKNSSVATAKISGKNLSTTTLATSPPKGKKNKSKELFQSKSFISDSTSNNNNNNNNDTNENNTTVINRGNSVSRLLVSAGIRKKPTLRDFLLRRGLQISSKDSPNAGAANENAFKGARNRSASTSTSFGNESNDYPDSNVFEIFGKKGDLFTVKESILQRISLDQVECTNTDVDNRIVEFSPGFWLELGKPWGSDSSLIVAKIEDEEKYEYYYRDRFYSRKHCNMIGLNDNKDFVIISVVQMEENEILQERQKEHDQLSSSKDFEKAITRKYYRSIIRTPKGEKREDLVFHTNAVVSSPSSNHRHSTKQISNKQMTKKLTNALEHLTKSKRLQVIDSSELTNDLLSYERKLVASNQKIGILLMTEGQTSEEEMFGNATSSERFEEFLLFLGNTITLNEHKGFTGGLDCKHNSTGDRSIYTKFHGLEIMFHVSTLLPHSSQDPQQVEKKRHIGNDICVIVFNESSRPYSPQTIKSEFNQVYAIIQPLEKSSSSGKTRYRLAMACKTGTPAFGPLLSEPSIFEKGDLFREFLLTKLVNGERAALEGASFVNKLRRTRKILLEELGKKYYRNK